MELDQRNVLLDEPILDFLARVPQPPRFDKQLYREAMLRTYPQLARFPAARRDNLEDWTALLAAETPVAIVRAASGSISIRPRCGAWLREWPGRQTAPGGPASVSGRSSGGRVAAPGPVVFDPLVVDPS
jgi:hypothetical protein